MTEGSVARAWAPERTPDRTARYATVRRQTERLASPLTPEDCALQSMPDASPVKWHLAHVTWFFETFVLVPFARGYQTFDSAFRTLFNSYYNAIGDKHPRPERGLLSRPDFPTIAAYRRHVDAAMNELLAAPLPDDARALVELGIEHERQHQELILTDVKHLFSRNPAGPVYRPAVPHDFQGPPPLAWHAYEGGLVTIGHEGSGFAFDNETPAHRIWVAPYALASAPVTNAEFVQFIADGGYRRSELWLSLGWDTACARGWEAPLYWRREAGDWRTFTLHGNDDVDPHAPVCHVSFFEAEAYARWAGARLPTEFEWELAARAQPIAGNFVERGALQPLPNAGAAGATGPQQMYGDVWQWTASAYAPYPGYRPAAGAVGEYNGKFMCSQYVLRGGSCVTPRAHIRATYRNFFPPDARWQFSGLRLARDQAA